MVDRSGYLDQFLEFWTGRDEIVKVWFSLFTPQIGADLPEILTPAQRKQVVEELAVLRVKYPKVDLAPLALKQFLTPPASPDECIFAQTTEIISADLKTRVKPCQFGGEPDCQQCGCVASMGLAAVGEYKLGGFIPVGKIFTASHKIGQALARSRAKNDPPTPTSPSGPPDLVTLQTSRIETEREPAGKR
jgi:hypothetical protein